MSNEKKVRKVLRSLPKRFESKVMVIEEAHDLTEMRLDDLIGNLTTYEMKFDSTEMVKKKGVALNASCKEGDEEDLKETVSLLVKNFNKTMKRFNKKPYSVGDSSGGRDRRFDSWKKNNKTIGGSNSTGQ
ncbi:hypothetical protein LIER_36176 [Lithospermum erythrorhizon]|uniref:Gag-pol polyprotein n=1 Tax=Lithospermum erythrorhizon TaxID=34254 RepID=A0AAV3P3C8_LITER